MSELEELEAKLEKLIKSRPSLMAYQYMIDHRLEHCETFDQKMEVLTELWNDRRMALREQEERLRMLARKLKNG